MKAELTYKEYCQKQGASNMWWTGFITMILGFFSIIISLIYVDTRIVKYHYITENIEIKGVSASQLFFMCSHDDDVWFMSFDGKYDGEKATVSLHTEAVAESNMYVVDLYAIATTIKDGNYFVNCEYVFTFIYW